MTTTRPSDEIPQIVKHPGCPQWGLGFLVEERDGKRFYDFEDGQLHSIAKDFWSKLEPVELATEEAQALEAKIKGLREKAAPTKKPRGRPTPVVNFTYDEQLTRFDAELPGGFEGEAFIAQERGTGQEAPEGTKKKPKGLKADAAATAQRLLARAELQPLLDAGDFTGIVGRIQRVHQSAGTLLHPLGDVIPFGKLPIEHNEAVAKAAFALLHGDGDFAERFDAYVEALAADKLNTWPLATVLPALMQPTEHVFVKPSFFEKQAIAIGFELGYERLPSSAAYLRMRELARTVSGKLAETGHSPRDLLDVYAFIARTVSTPKAPAPPKPSAKPPPPG